MGRRVTASTPERQHDRSWGWDADPRLDVYVDGKPVHLKLTLESVGGRNYYEGETD